MIIEESKCRLLNKDEESVKSESIPLIMRSHPFLHQIHLALIVLRACDIEYNIFW